MGCPVDGKRPAIAEEPRRSLRSCEEDAGKEGSCKKFDDDDCRWTLKWSCPGQQPKGKDGVASGDGTLGFRCCCYEGLWKRMMGVEKHEPEPEPEEGAAARTAHKATARKAHEEAENSTADVSRPKS